MDAETAVNTVPLTDAEKQMVRDFAVAAQPYYQLFKWEWSVLHGDDLIEGVVPTVDDIIETVTRLMGRLIPNHPYKDPPLFAESGGLTVLLYGLLGERRWDVRFSPVYARMENIKDPARVSNPGRYPFAAKEIA
jgi:hypothetical protein